MKQTMNPFQVEDPPWIKVMKDDEDDKDHDPVDYRPYTAAIRHRSAELASISDEEEVDRIDYLKTAPVNMHMHRQDDDDDDIVFHANKQNMRVFSTITSDDRPITPMRDRMVYDKEHSSLDFKDGKSFF